MGWFNAAKTRRSEPSSSIEGRLFAGIIRNEPDLAKDMKQREYDLAPSRVTVDKLLPSLKEIDIRADRDAFTRAKQAGFSSEEAMDIVKTIRDRRDRQRGENAALQAKVKAAMEAKKHGTMSLVSTTQS